MGARRIVDYVFKVSKDDVSPRFKSLERAQRRFQSNSAKGWQGYERTANRSISNVSRHGRRQFRQLGREARDALSGRLAQVVGAAGAGLAIKKGVTDLALLGDQMSGIAIKLRQPVESLQDVQKELLNFSRLPGIRESADGLAAAVNILVGADFKLADAVKIVKASAKGASVALTETGVVTKGLTSILKGFGIEGSRAEEVISKMIRAADLGVIELEDLSSAMVDVVAPAIQMGASIEEVLALLETLSVSGVANASEASTAVARMLERFSETEFRKKALRFGIRVVDESGNLKSPITILDLISERFEKLDNDVKRAKFIERLTGGEIRTKRALLPLLKNMEKVKSAVKDISSSGGRLDEAFSESQKRLSAKFAKFRNDLKAVNTDFSTLFEPGIEMFSKFVQENFDPQAGQATFSDNVRSMIRGSAEEIENEDLGSWFWNRILLDPLKFWTPDLTSLPDTIKKQMSILFPGVTVLKGLSNSLPIKKTNNSSSGPSMATAQFSDRFGLNIPRNLDLRDLKTKSKEPISFKPQTGLNPESKGVAPIIINPEVNNESKQPVIFNPKISIINKITAATGKTRTEISIDDPTKMQRRVPIGVSP